LSAVKAIRDFDSCCTITLISAESYNAYSPVALTYYLKGVILRDGLFIVDSDFYIANHVKTILGNEATMVDPSRQTVHLKNGEEVEYDNLLIATGASPIHLDILGDGPANVFSVRTIEDAESIFECVRRAKEITVVGAGLIGLQVSDALFREKNKLTIIESAGQVLPELVDVDCASILQTEIESYGISVLLGRRIKKIEKRGKKAVVVSDSGEETEADMVIVGIGLKPNTHLVNDSGIVVNRGILVDERMRTNVDNIFAAGDVAEGENVVTGEKEVLPTWSNACHQGRIAGLNMVGCAQSYEGGLRETITTIFGLTVAAIGLTKTPMYSGIKELSFTNPDRMSYRKILLADSRVVGAILLGRTGDAGILSNLIRNRKDISLWEEEIARNSLDVRKLLSPIVSY